MIIHPEYGPQIDPTDGTCGSVKLVKRYVMVSGEHGFIWGTSQGRYTEPTLAKMKKRVAEIKRCNYEDRYPADLRPAAWWCWPGHFDPAYPVSEEELPL